MASAPPMETTTLVGHPPVPSYEESVSINPQYPPGYSMPYPPVDTKGSQPPYPTQAYSQMYPLPQQAQPTSSPVVQVQTVHVHAAVRFGDAPVQTRCPVCTQNVITRLVYRSGALAWLSCLGLALIGCDCGCCLIPFCMDSCKDVTHCCPNCSNVLGTYKRM